MARSRNILAYLIIFISLYIYIYNPIFVGIGIGLIKVLLLFSLVYFVSNFSLVKTYIKDCSAINLLLFFAIIYCAFVITLYSGNANSPYTMLIWFLECMFIPPFLIRKFFLKYGISLFNTLITISLVAAGISIFLFLNPGINDFILGGVIEIPYENNLKFWNRCFGIAEALTSSYGVIQGIFSSLCLLKGKQSPRYYFFAFIIALSAAINARTGLIPIIITFLYVVFRNIKTFQVSFFIVLGIVTIAVITFIGKLGEEYYGTIEFISRFFTSSFDFFIKGDTGDDYYGALEGFIHFPKTFFGILFGEGRTMFGDANTSSDIGYVNQIYTGGLIYLTTLIILQIKIYKKMLFRYEVRFFVFLLFATAFIINFKGISFCMSEGFSRFVMLFYFVLLHNKMCPQEKIQIGL